MWKPFILRGSKASGYHPDNILITKGCTGRRIGIPQRIRVTTRNRTHRNYTKCVKSDRVGINLPKLSWKNEKRMRKLEAEYKDVLTEMTAIKGVEEALKKLEGN